MYVCLSARSVSDVEGLGFIYKLNGGHISHMSPLTKRSGSSRNFRRMEPKTVVYVRADSPAIIKCSLAIGGKGASLAIRHLPFARQINTRTHTPTWPPEVIYSIIQIITQTDVPTTEALSLRSPPFIRPTQIL